MVGCLNASPRSSKKPIPLGLALTFDSTKLITRMSMGLLWVIVTER